MYPITLLLTATNEAMASPVCRFVCLMVSWSSEPNLMNLGGRVLTFDFERIWILKEFGLI